MHDFRVCLIITILLLSKQIMEEKSSFVVKPVAISSFAPEVTSNLNTLTDISLSVEKGDCPVRGQTVIIKDSVFNDCLEWSFSS